MQRKQEREEKKLEKQRACRFPGHEHIGIQLEFRFPFLSRGPAVTHQALLLSIRHRTAALRRDATAAPRVQFCALPRILLFFNSK